MRGSYRALAKKRRRRRRAAAAAAARKRLDLDARMAVDRGLGPRRASEPMLVPLESVTLDTTFTRAAGVRHLDQRARVGQRAGRGDRPRAVRGARARRRGGSGGAAAAIGGSSSTRSPTAACQRADRADHRGPARACSCGTSSGRTSGDRLRDHGGPVRASRGARSACTRASARTAAGDRDRARAHRGRADPADVHRRRSRRLLPVRLRARDRSRAARRRCGSGSPHRREEPVDVRELPRLATARRSATDLDVLVGPCEQVIAVDLTHARARRAGREGDRARPRDRRGGAGMTDDRVRRTDADGDEVARAAARSSVRPPAGVGDVLRASRERVHADRDHRRLLRAHGRGLAQGDPDRAREGHRGVGRGEHGRVARGRARAVRDASASARSIAAFTRGVLDARRRGRGRAPARRESAIARCPTRSSTCATGLARARQRVITRAHARCAGRARARAVLSRASWARADCRATVAPPALPRTAARRARGMAEARPEGRRRAAAAAPARAPIAAQATARSRVPRTWALRQLERLSRR